jgi:hypothetical protein
MCNNKRPFAELQQPIASTFVTEVQERLRRQRLVEQLHALGPAPLGHFIREIENGACIPDHLDRYSRIDPEFVRAFRGDRYVPTLNAVEGGSA